MIIKILIGTCIKTEKIVKAIMNRMIKNYEDNEDEYNE